MDNRNVQRIIIFISLWNLYSSYNKSKKEWAILKEIIIKNDDFFKALATLGFEAKPGIFSLISIMPYSEEYSIEDIKKTANITIIGTIMKYVKDENLLGIIHVDCDVQVEKNMIVTTITPTTGSILAADIYDACWSVAITTGSILLFFAVKYFFF